MACTINIHACLSICTETGKPYYIGPKGNMYKKIFEIPEINIPQEHRRFLNESNGIYPIYVNDTDKIKNFEDIDYILEYFPTWDNLKIRFPNLENDFNWSELDHNSFKTSLQWFSKQYVRFIVVW
jgi:hypothetical protein